MDYYISTILGQILGPVTSSRHYSLTLRDLRPVRYGIYTTENRLLLKELLHLQDLYEVSYVEKNYIYKPSYIKPTE